MRALFRVLLLLMAMVLQSRHAAAVPGPLDDVYKPFNRILPRLVRVVAYTDRGDSFVRTQIRYALLEDDADWPAYRKTLTRCDGSTVRTLRGNDAMAFWLNVYNALTLEAVAKSPVLVATRDATLQSEPGFYTDKHAIAGFEISLSEIEDKIAVLDDPRAWFALHEPTVSGTSLPPAAFDPTDLDRQLDEAVRNFLADPTKFKFDREKNRLVLSDMFRRQGPRFESITRTVPPGAQPYSSAERGIVAFILPRIRPVDRDYIVEKRPKIAYDEYNWAVNVAR